MECYIICHLTNHFIGATPAIWLYPNSSIQALNVPLCLNAQKPFVTQRTFFGIVDLLTLRHTPILFIFLNSFRMKSFFEIIPDDSKLVKNLWDY